MTLWLALGAMMALALAIVLIPLLRRPRGQASRTAYDLEIYRDQLAEVEREVARGLLSADQAEAARAEIGRRALAAADREDDEDRPARPPRFRWGGAAAGVLACALAGFVYLEVGSPRLAVPEAPTPDAAALIARLEARMRENPGDPRGWALLGRSLATTDRYAEAADAYGRAVALLPNDPDLLSRYGETLALAAGGTVTREARGAFEAAVAVDPGQPRARYYLGLADYQAGRPREALARWQALEADSPPNAPWLAVLRPRIETLARELGVALADRPAAPPGPTEEDVRNAQSMTPEARQAMIRSMVDGLARRLESAPGDFDGWMRLGRSYAVLKEHGKSRDAYRHAAALRPDSIPALAAHAAAIAEDRAGAVGADAELPGVLDRLLRLDPNNTIGLWLAGAVASQAGDPAEARRHWSHLLTLLPPGSPRRIDLEGRIAALPKSGE